MSEEKSKFSTLKNLVLIGSILAVLTGCSLAVDTQQEISIPLKEDGFQLNTNVSFDRIEGFAEE